MPKISIRVGKIKIIKQMKKLFITLAFVAAAAFAQAQFFVGGNLGVKIGNTTVESTKTQKVFNFNVTPNVGFMFSDNMGAGIELNFDSQKITTPKDGDAPETWTKTTTFGVTPYFRYVFAEVDNFRFYADAKINFAKGKIKNQQPKADDPTATETVDGNKTTDFGINIVPGIQYNFDDHFSMVANVNILQLGWNQKTTEAKKVNQEGKEYTEKTKKSDIGFGVNVPTPITIGFVYTF